MTRAHPAFAVLLVLAAFSAGAIEVEFSSAAVRGVRIVSADIARNLDSSAESLVVGLRNEEEAGQVATLAVTVHDESGNRKGMRAQPVEVAGFSDSQQVFSLSIPSFADTGDTLTVQLLDWAASSSDLDEPISDGQQGRPLGRMEECELDEATKSRVDELKEQLNSERRSYSEEHPSVVRLKRLLADVTRDALAECVEELQRG